MKWLSLLLLFSSVSFAKVVLVDPGHGGDESGAVGYLDYAGNLDTCIALRTIVWRNGVYDIQVGAGVVADSIPASEYEETMSKAKAMLKAVEIAQAGF